MLGWTSAATETWLFHQELSGMIKVKTISKIYKFYFFLYFKCPKLTIKSLNADVGPRRPTTLQPYERRHPAAAAPAPQG